MRIFSITTTFICHLSLDLITFKKLDAPTNHSYSSEEWINCDWSILKFRILLNPIKNDT